MFNNKTFFKLRHKVKTTYGHIRVPITFLPVRVTGSPFHIYSLLYCTYLSSRALGQHLPTQCRHHAVVTRSLSYLVLVFPLCASTFSYPRQPSYSTRRASRSTKSSCFILHFTHLCVLFPLGDRLGGTAVHAISADLPRSRFLSTPLLLFFPLSSPPRSFLFSGRFRSTWPSYITYLHKFWETARPCHHPDNDLYPGWEAWNLSPVIDDLPAA
jgi:hypothetical protein